MKNRRYSGRDYHLWPFTLSLTKYRNFGAVLDSGAYEDQRGGCHIKFFLFGVVLICELPPIIPDYVVRHQAKTWDADTIARLGRDWYEERHSREFGFTFSGDGDLHTYFGPQTHCSSTTKGRVFFLPWRQWRHIRRSLFDSKGNHFWTEFDVRGQHTAWEAYKAVENVCPTVSFEFDDYDGQRITVKTRIEEREWRFGTGLFRWLSLIRPARIRRYLDLEFRSEVGPEKGSWKGGTLGHSIEMLPGEMHEAAFRRYCEQEHRSKYRRFQIKFAGLIPAVSVNAGDGAVEQPTP